MFAAATRRGVAVVRTILQTLLQATLFAAAVALVVWLLPGKLPVALFSLYGFICVWLLQLGAAFILVLTLLQAPFSADARRDAGKALLICGGFVIAIALLNAYILVLAQAFGRDFGASVHHIALTSFLTADNRVIAAVASDGASVAAFVDRIAVTLLHLSYPPLQTFFAGLAVWIGHLANLVMGAAPAKLAGVIRCGAASGLVFALWTQLARSRD